MTWAIIATGPSINKEDIAYIGEKRAEGILKGVIAISNAGLDLCPWADALVSHDSAWWISYPEALQFKGVKFSSRGYRNTRQFDPKDRGFKGGINSGLMGMLVARDIYNAKKLIILGFDMNRSKGQHYFGRHERVYNGKCLYNTDDKKFEIHIKQFNQFTGPEVFNCSPQSSLKKFPIVSLRDII